MTTKPKKKYTSKLKAIEEMYGDKKRAGLKTLMTDKEMGEYLSKKESKALRGFLMGHD